MLVAAAAAVTDPPQLFTIFGVAATTRFAGRVSVKLPLIGTTLAFVILKVMVLEAPIATTGGAKALVIVGGSRMMMPPLGVPPLDAANPAAFAVLVNYLAVGVLRTLRS